MRILIAEDNLTSRTMLSAVLRKHGHEVVETVDGAAAWDVLQQPDAPGLVILDWMMPEMDGPEVVRLARSQPTQRPPYIIMLTNRTAKADIITTLDAGANDYLAKPFDAGELRARVEVGCRMVEMHDDLIASRQALAHEAAHDTLTGMLNRRAILERLAQELARVARSSGSLAIGICDVDHFKLVNDTFGHQAGDDVLCGLARRITESLRSYDELVRLGGEELLVIAPLKAGSDSVSLFDRLTAGVAATPVETRSGLVTVTVSIGVADATPGSSVDEILARADAALYAAKRSGRNRVVRAARAA